MNPQILLIVYLCGACISAAIQLILSAAITPDEIPASWKQDALFILRVLFWPVALFIR